MCFWGKTSLFGKRRISRNIVLPKNEKSIYSNSIRCVSFAKKEFFMRKFYIFSADAFINQGYLVPHSPSHLLSYRADLDAYVTKGIEYDIKMMPREIWVHRGNEPSRKWRLFLYISKKQYFYCWGFFSEWYHWICILCKGKQKYRTTKTE